MRNRKLRVLSLLLAVVMLAGLFAGCSKNTANGDSKDTGKTSEKTSTKDSITIATMSETPSMSPYDHNATAGSYMNLLTYNTLFKSNMDMEPVPALVDTYENISDTEWKMTLKKGIKFHNGETMTANDVKASIEYGKTFPEVSLYNDCVKSIEVVDDQTFIVHTNGVSAVLLNHLCHHGNAIVPKSLIDKGNDFNKNPIGSGPYVFKNWVLGDKVEFEAFADYYDGAPAIKKMTWKIIPEGSSRTIALEAGEIDFIVEVEAMDYDRLKENKDVSIYEYNATEHNWMMLNNEKPGLDNVLVRKALNAAIDKEAIVTVALNGRGTAITSHVPNNLPGYSDKNAVKYDPEQAKKWLAESGVPASDIYFSIICSNDTKKRAAEVIQANVKEVLGIKCDIESMDLATYLSTTGEGNYTASIGNYTASDMLSFMIGVYHSKSINGSNKTRLNNKDVDALIDKASATLDPDERNKTLEECSALINELCPQVPIYQPINFRAYNSGLKGVEVTPSGTLYFENVYWG
ncbi:ABC transporter substrate-binding protein [Acidaminobacterium chupaoyuni]